MFLSFFLYNSSKSFSSKGCHPVTKKHEMLIQQGFQAVTALGCHLHLAFTHAAPETKKPPEGGSDC
jgi:hypothetical protein